MKPILLFLTCFSLFMITTSESCLGNDPVSSSGANKAQTKISLDLNGNSIEQNNIIQRLRVDNTPGSIKHLYIISVYSGEVMIYSTVKGKVTSSGKRLSPANASSAANGFLIQMPGNNSFYTQEVLGDDGTYGNSIEYIYWWDSKNVYHQQYISGGMMVHISDQPLAVKQITLNMETVVKNGN